MYGRDKTLIHEVEDFENFCARHNEKTQVKLYVIDKSD